VTSAIPARVTGRGNAFAPASHPTAVANTGSMSIAMATTVASRYLRLATYPAVPTTVPKTAMKVCGAICSRVSHPNTPPAGSSGRRKNAPPGFSNAAARATTIGRLIAICIRSRCESSTASRTRLASTKKPAPENAPARTTASPRSVASRRPENERRFMSSELFEDNGGEPADDAPG
jgi:hypothetical protein